jgi:murein DD-endopeptidase MepM/ murein hydrolase activator NlpD
MATILENQHVAKRHRKSFVHNNNKSASFNGEFMYRFVQKPAYMGKKKNSGTGKPFSFVRPVKPIRIRPSESEQEKQSEKGFSFPIPSVMTLAAAAGIVVVSLFVLNWEGVHAKVLDWEGILTKMPDDYTFQDVAGNESERYVFKYAETGITVFSPVADVPERELNTVEEASAKNTEVLSEAMEVFEWSQYKVQKGDSVSEIAKKFSISMSSIIASNEIHNAKRLREGAVLRIPNIDGIPYSIKKGDNLSLIAKNFKVPLEVILDVNDVRSDAIREGEVLFIPGARMNDMDLRKSLGELFIYPVSKTITSDYGWRKDPISGKQTFHTGVDFRANTGTAVKAALDGTVSVVSTNWLYGQHIILSHSNGYKTLYAHLSAFSVKKGDRVLQGKKIGEVGSTGYSTGPHLHFGMYDKSGKLVNPLALLD